MTILSGKVKLVGRVINHASNFRLLSHLIFDFKIEQLIAENLNCFP